MLLCKHFRGDCEEVKEKLCAESSNSKNVTYVEDSIRQHISGIYLLSKHYLACILLVHYWLRWLKSLFLAGLRCVEIMAKLLALLFLITLFVSIVVSIVLLRMS